MKRLKINYIIPSFCLFHHVISYNEVMGHQLVKLENEDSVQDRNTDDDIPVPIIMNNKSKPEDRVRSNHNKLRKPASHSTIKDRRLSSEDDSYSSYNVRNLFSIWHFPFLFRTISFIYQVFVYLQGRPRSNSSSKVGSQRNRSQHSQRSASKYGLILVVLHYALSKFKCTIS